MRQIVYWCVSILLITTIIDVCMPRTVNILCSALVDVASHDGSSDAMSDELLGLLPEGVTLLTSTNFDAYVFPQHTRKHKSTPHRNKTSQTLLKEDAIEPKTPWLIMFYAPWCKHCKTVIPRFFNASLLLETKLKYPHAKFGIVNAEQYSSLRERFGVHRYPTFIYTMGEYINNNVDNLEVKTVSPDAEYRAFLEHRWYVYQGGHSIESLTQFAIVLKAAADHGSFTTNVSDIRVFSQWVASGKRSTDGDKDAQLFVYVPETSSKESSSYSSSSSSSSSSSPSSLCTYHNASWNVILDNIASFGNIRLGVIFESELTPGWETDASSLYIRVVKTAQACILEGKASGPNGELLISTSDRFSKPQCYNGPWIDDVNEQKKVTEIMKESAKLTSKYTERSLYTDLQRLVNRLVYLGKNTVMHTNYSYVPTNESESIIVNKEFIEKIEPLRERLQRAPFLHSNLEEFVVANSYCAVEELSAGMLSALEREGTHYIGILVLNESVSIDKDTNYIPALRKAVQELNEVQIQTILARSAQTADTKNNNETYSSKGVKNKVARSTDNSVSIDNPTITWTYLNGHLQKEWLEKLKLEQSDLPSVIIFDVKRDRLFRIKTHMPEFDHVKAHIPWPINGTQQHIIQKFARNTITGVYRGEKSSLLGTIAEFFADMPILSAFYASLQYDDTLFVIVLVSVVVFIAIMIMLFCHEPEITESERERARVAARASTKLPARDVEKKTQEKEKDV